MNAEPLSAPRAPPGAARRLIRLDEVAALTRLGKSTVRRLDAQGEFPRHVQLTPRAVAWFEDEVFAWIEHRASERERN